MPKRLSEDQKVDILDSFINGMAIKDLANIYSYSIPTISRLLKGKLGDIEFKKIKKVNLNIHSKETSINYFSETKNNFISEKIDTSKSEDNLSINDNSSHDFFEIAPLTNEIDLENQKDLSSIPLDEVTLPKIIYMIVDNKIELIIKFLRDYPEWDFLSEIELNRKTIQIFFDIKKAKKQCGKDQKVIKVPDANVFKLVSPILLSRGISRILTEDLLIAI